MGGALCYCMQAPPGAVRLVRQTRVSVCISQNVTCRFFRAASYNDCVPRLRGRIPGASLKDYRCSGHILFI